VRKLATPSARAFVRLSASVMIALPHRARLDRSM